MISERPGHAPYFLGPGCLGESTCPFRVPRARTHLFGTSPPLVPRKVGSRCQPRSRQPRGCGSAGALPRMASGYLTVAQRCGGRHGARVVPVPGVGSVLRRDLPRGGGVSSLGGGAGGGAVPAHYLLPTHPPRQEGYPTGPGNPGPPQAGSFSVSPTYPIRQEPGAAGAAGAEGGLAGLVGRGSPSPWGPSER